MKRTLRLAHARHEIALHRLSDERGGTPLLWLHAVGASAQAAAERCDAWQVSKHWPGPIWALDFSGHGASDWIRGGPYSSELLAADADMALAELGDRACLLGEGVGGYAALLLAGARPDAVPAIAVAEGRGLEGRSVAVPPRTPAPSQRGNPDVDAFDPRTAALECELRPLAYIDAYARRAQRVFQISPAAPAWTEGETPAHFSSVASPADAFAALAAADAG